MDFEEALLNHIQSQLPSDVIVTDAKVIWDPTATRYDPTYGGGEAEPLLEIEVTYSHMWPVWDPKPTESTTTIGFADTFTSILRGALKVSER